MAARESVEGVLGHLTIALHAESYAPGEVVTGVVKLSTLELIQAREPLAVLVQGKETVAWDEGGYNPVTNAFDKIFLQEKIELVPTTLFSAGDSEYSFNFTLPKDLPSSFELTDVYSGTAERLRVRVKYEASVWLRAEGDSVAYLQTSQEFSVHAPPTATPPARALEITTSEVVHWLCCINRGSLQMMLEIPKDVFVAGEVVPLVCRVDGSACKASVKSISVELIEDVALRNLGERPDWTVTRQLSTQQVFGPDAGHKGEQVVEVGLVENDKKTAINPDVATHFFRCTHRLIVHCKPFMAQSIMAEVPVRVLHHNTSFSTGAVRVLRLPAEATSGSKSP
ncbi:hypothetical protein PHYSODRAFT_312882 [Phytophthora sojae]|uniref:Arrestin C-terminal-like domain-containing protein n=1 Tax=Phytophthora sojae (strain P6497) TaxID=1094619 RepID=G4Z314_PHYSP|nr:hypothetical protein PHYSODRAFT_312882 [Phytophthora sojae]EGZ20043.1 hypothetical protein PHYSODRAFT_312882 [Phytophthora sojae]|eukprot:XP_009522760.1 hypothetical protein PHYSODRAFT_312882 [Phytophthora sojae]